MLNNNYTKIKLNDAYFVSSENEFCYKEVLDTFKDAKYIDILTFNISTSNTDLLDAIKNVGDKDIPIRIVSNIPNRWPNYWGRNSRKKASDSIKTYMRKLNPESIGSLTSIFFNFNNHAKIILTDKMIYWGSSNFSDESRKNYECGAISTDLSFINHIHNKIISDIITNSINYYKRNYINYITGLYGSISFIHNMFEEIHDASYGIYEDYDTNFEPKEYFDYNNNYITWNLLEKLMETVNGFEELLSNIIYDLDDEYEDFSSDDDFEHYDEVNILVTEFNENIESINSNILEICFALKDMVEYDDEDRTFQILNDDYGNMADEENLNYYLELSSEQAREYNEILIENAKEDIESLLKYLEEYEKILMSYVDKLTNLCQENDKIDNT